LEKAAKDLSEKIMPIGAKMYEQASKDEAKPAEEGETKDSKKKSDKEEPIEGEVVDDDSTK
jgi:molecular chaperone DnaK